MGCGASLPGGSVTYAAVEITTGSNRGFNVNAKRRQALSIRSNLSKLDASGHGGTRISAGQYSIAGAEPSGPKENQDRGLILMDAVERTNVLAVMDGHGENGAEVSSFLQNEVPTMLTDVLGKHLSGRADANFLKLLSKEFTRLDEKLAGPRFLHSGSTATICVHSGDLLLLAAVGDSRAVLGSVGQSAGTFTSTLLSFDHKADRPEEQARLVKHGAEVRPIFANGRQFGPARLFKKGEDYPGLAVSRAFGDRMSKDIGVVAMPELAVHHLAVEDRCVVIASDGVWDQVTNEEAVRIAMTCYHDNDPQSAAIALCKEARRRWERGLKTSAGEETAGNIDDITSVIGFLFPVDSSLSTLPETNPVPPPPANSSPPAASGQ